MSDKTAIEWTDATWNPVRGCTRVSAGCRNCYAERIAARFAGPGQPYEGLAAMTKAGPRWTGTVRLVDEALDQPLRWRRPRRVFVNSMSDLFHEGLSDAAITHVFSTMETAKQHVFQVLTKRPLRMRAFVADYVARGRKLDMPTAVLPNVWLGVSVEDQATANERIPILLETPAAVRFISAEPLLGPIDLTKVREQLAAESFQIFNALDHPDTLNRGRCRQGLDWVIAGGESGPGARPMHPAWVRAIRDQCAAAGVPFFFKQWGELHYVEGNAGRDDIGWYRVGKKSAGAALDDREHREFPRGST